MPEIEIILVLIIVAFFSGLIDAAVGGGGLIQVPGIFSALPNEVPATNFGINKFSSICGTTMAVRQYLRRVKLPWGLMLPAMICAFSASFVGAMVVSIIPVHLMKPIILGLLIFMAIYTLIKKDFGSIQKPLVVTRREKIGAAALGAATGFYDGVFGPGAGSFMSFLFVRFFAFDFLHAAAAARVVNFMTNLAALSFFIPTGHIIWMYALPMAACNMAGGVLGARVAIKGGVRLIRILFLCLMSVLITRFAYDVFFK
ncbi:MAG: sulfite exporter TauE/SafE family protein [Burkholderiales bacterium]|nr:sulfite exporter TauE/SafE family protein [Burkholderiales bacterium]